MSKYREVLKTKPRLFLGLVLAVALVAVGSLVVYAAGYKIITEGSWALIGEAVYRAYYPPAASGSGTYYSFVRVSAANKCVTRGYNTDFRPLEFDENTSPSFTRSFLLSGVPLIGDPDVPGLYREFQLDANQSTNYIAVDEVEIYLTNNPNLTGYPFAGTASKIYELDSGEDNWVILNVTLAAGSGKRDMTLRVPDAYFHDPTYPYCGYMEPGCMTYVVIYSEFGRATPDPDLGDICNNDGYEEWGVQPYVLATKSGYKWWDRDGDGVWDAGEPPLEGWTIYVDYDADGQFDPVEPYDVTDATGYYEIPVVVGTYTVREVPQDGWWCTYPTPCSYTHNFQEKTIYPNNNFGNNRPSVDLIKTGDRLSKVGDEANYTITLVNTTPSPSPDLECTITDPLLGINETVTLPPGGQYVINATYTVPPGAPDPLINTAQASCTFVGSPVVVASDSASWSVDLFDPCVDVTKTGDELSKVGDTVTYNVTIQNCSSAGSPDLILDSFSDTLVAGVVPPAGCSRLALGASCTFSYEYLVPQGAPDPLLNTATAHYHPEGFPNDVWDSDGHSVNLFQPCVDLTKTGDPLSKVGDRVTYDVTIQNCSSADSPALVLDSFSDSLVPGVQLPPECSRLAPGASCLVSYNRTVQPGDPDPVVNVATVHYHPDGYPNDVSDSDDHMVYLFEPAIDITKSGDPLSKVGDEVTYTITLYNNSSSDTPPLVCTISDPTIGFTRNVVLPSGQSDVSVVPFVIPAGAGDPFVNTVTATCSPEGFPNVYTDEASWSTNLFQPCVDLDKTGDRLSKVGDTVTYNVTIQNCSSADSPALVLDSFSDSLVPGLQLPPQCSPLAPGASCSFSYEYMVPQGAPDPLLNTATVHYHPQGYPNDISDADGHSVDLFQPAIDITKVGDPLSKVGDEVTYTITLYNNSSPDTPPLACTISDPTIGFSKSVTLPSGANDVSVVPFTIPAGAADPFVNTVTATCSPEGFPNVYTDSAMWTTQLFQPAIDITKVGDPLSKIGDEVTYTITLYNTSSPDTPDLVCDISDPTIGFSKRVTLPSGQNDVSVVPFVIPAGAVDPFVNTVSVTCSPTGFPNVYTDSATWSTNLFQPAIDIIKIGDRLSKVGDEVMYTITLNNYSSADTPPLECTISDPTIGFSKNVTLPSGQSDTSTVPFVIPQGAPDPFVNTVTATCSPVGFPNVYTASATWTTQLFQPAIDITKEGDELSKRGDSVTYTITLYNNSSPDTPDLVCDISDPTIGFSKSVTLPSGTSDVSVVPFVIPGDAPDPFVNTVSVTCSPEGFPNVYADSASWTTDLFGPQINLTKTGDPLSKVGDEVTYTITLYNNSTPDTPLLECTISDPTIGFSKSVTLPSGASDVSVVPFTIPAGAADPFVNTVTASCSPIGFPNVVTDEASWSTNLFQPAIDIIKVGDPLSKIGDEVTYTITLYNNSSADTPDLLCDISDPTIGFSKSVTLPSGASDVSVMPFTIPADAVDPFVNAVSVTCSPEGFPNVYTDSARWTTELFQPAIDITKTGDELSKVGDEVTYTITLYNNSSPDTPDLVCDISDPTIGFSKSVTLPSGASDVSVVPFTIPAGAVDPFVNTVSVACSPEGFPNVYEDEATWSTNLFQPAIDITKVGDPLSKIGDEVTYTITLYNNSSADTPDLVCDISDATIGFSKSVTLPSGASDVSVVPFTIPAGAVDPFVNTVSVTCSPEGFPNVYADSAAWTTELFQPAIDITKVGDPLSKIGDEVTYTITLYNNSSADTPDLECTISDPTIGFSKSVTLPSGQSDTSTVTFVIPQGAPDPFVNTVTATCSPVGFPNVYADSATWTTQLFQPAIDITKVGDPLSKIGDEVTYTITLYNNSSPDTPPLDCIIEDLTIGFSKSVTLPSGTSDVSVVPFVIPGDAPDPFVNTVSVTCSPEGFPNVYADSATWTTQLFQPAIELTKVGDPLSKVGDEVTYVITLYNNSSADTPDLACTITDPTIGFSKSVVLPWGLSDTSTVPFVIPVGAPDPFVNTVTASCSPIGFPNVYADEATWTTNLFQPCLELAKEGDPYSKVGDTITYEITLHNCSSADSPDLILYSFSDSLVPGVVPPAGCQILDPGETCMFAYTYTVQPGDDPGEPGATLDNVAVAVYNPEGFANIISDTDSWSTTLLHPNYTVTKTCATPLVDPGKPATFQVVFENTGDVDLIVVADEELCNGGGCLPAGTPFNLGVGQSRTFVVTIVAGSNPTVDNTIHALATLPGMYDLPNELARTDSDSCTVAASKSGYKWEDIDRDGVWDAGEPGLNGWRIELRDANGNLLAYMLTYQKAGKAGYYEFAHLWPGQYTVKEVCPPGWFQSYPAPVNNVCGSGVWKVTLIGGQVDTNNNFGNFPSEVPEASTLILLGSGLAGLAGYASLQIRARRRK